MSDSNNVIALINVGRHLAKTGRLEPHQESALKLLDEKLNAIPEAREVLLEATRVWRQPPPPPSNVELYLELTWTGRYRTVYGRQFLDLSLCHSQTKERVPVISGAPSAQVLEHPSRDWAGSNRPIPEGYYRIGPVEVAQVCWGPGIGKIWISLDVEPGYRLNNRSAFGFHLDNNAATAPGSAGCVVTPDPKVLSKIVSWVSSGCRSLRVDYGFGVVKAKPTGVYEITPRRKAWLDLIAWAEGTLNSNGYRTMFTGKLFNSFHDHPRIIQWGGGWSSDAAGRYQFLSTTWDEVRRAMGLRDFSPESQDQAALWLIDVKRGVLNELDNGNWLRVLDSISWEWASLPASNGRGRYGQPIKTIEQVRQRLQQTGGI